MLSWVSGLSMWAWLKRRRSIARRHPGPDAAPRPRAVVTGAYAALYKYLADRYADTVVLTFAEIEDILGFTLPDVARLRAEWWTDPDPDSPRPIYSDSWVLASRTAQPNMLAMIVVFDRAF